MTLMSVDYKENKWKNGHDGGVLAKTKPILSLSNSILLLAAIVSIVVLKFMVVLTGKPAMYILIDIGTSMLNKVELLLNWLSENYGHFSWPLIKGLSWTIASWTLLYLDSSLPGVNPPTTLSPRKTRRDKVIPETSHHIGYATSFAIGIVVFSLNLLNERN